jgi:hypothetical protein
MVLGDVHEDLASTACVLAARLSIVLLVACAETRPRAAPAYTDASLREPAVALVLVPFQLDASRVDGRPMREIYPLRGPGPISAEMAATAGAAIRQRLEPTFILHDLDIKPGLIQLVVEATWWSAAEQLYPGLADRLQPLCGADVRRWSTIGPTDRLGYTGPAGGYSIVRLHATKSATRYDRAAWSIECATTPGAQLTRAVGTKQDRTTLEVVLAHPALRIREQVIRTVGRITGDGCSNVLVTPCDPHSPLFIQMAPSETTTRERAARVDELVDRLWLEHGVRSECDGTTRLTVRLHVQSARTERVAGHDPAVHTESEITLEPALIDIFTGEQLPLEAPRCT